MRCSPLAFEATVSFPQNQICHWTTKPQWFVTLPLTCVKRFLGRDRQQKTTQEEPVGGGLFFLAFERLKWSKLVGFSLGNDSQIPSDSHHVPTDPRVGEAITFSQIEQLKRTTTHHVERLYVAFREMPGPRFELGTRRFSVACSTN